MLEKVRFKGFETASSQFKEHEDAEGGKYRVSFEGYGVTSEKDEEEGTCWIQIEVKPTIQGFSESDPENKEPVFEVDLTIVLFFDYLSDEPLGEEYITENIWFFENFITISTKLAVESTLNHTALNTIKLPWSTPA
ncbi:hypothetical protein [Serratia liquefaciens]|uniref:hypothetical protein n=1 Tax=Serratia liquefaciens TaxID=614 RepID=UPI00352438C9